MKKIIALILVLLIIPCVSVGAAELTGKENWKIEVTNPGSSVELPNPAAMIDGKADKIWHSPIVENLPPLPYEIVITLPAVTEINGIKYTPRTTGNSDAGNWRGFDVYYSETDGGSFVKAGTYEIKKNFEIFEAAFPSKVKAKKVKIVVTAAVRNYCVVGEIDILTDAVASTTESTGNVEMAISNPYIISGGDKSGWQIEITNPATGTRFNTGSVANVLDGKAETIFHSPTTQPIPPLPYEIEIIMYKAAEIGGIKYTPRPDNNSDAGIIMGGTIYVAESDSAEWRKVKDFDIAKSFDPTEILFGASVNAKKIKIVVTKTIRNYCVIGDIDVLTKDKATGNAADGVAEETKKEETKTESTGVVTTGKKAGWKVEISKDGENYGGGEKIADGDASTFFHSPITDPKTLPPFDVNITLPELTYISGLIYTPRTSTSSSGIVSKLEVYASESDDGEFYHINTYELAKDQSVKVIEFDSNILVKRLKLVVTDGMNGYCVIAEIDVRDAIDGYKDLTASEYAAQLEAMKLYEMDKTFMRAWSESVWGDDYVGQNVFDASASGDKMWHYKPGTPMPVILDVDLNVVGRIAAFKYVPRVKDTSGHWVEFNLLASVDGENYTPVLEARRLDPASFDPVTIRFDEPVEARYFRFEVLNGRGGHAACQELAFYQFKDDMEASILNNREIYTLKIGSNVLNVTKGQENYDVDLGVAPFIVSGTTMIPLRGLLEEMGATIAWDGTIDQITIEKKGNDTMVMQVEHEPVLIGGRRYSMLIAPRIVNSRTFIPLRFVSEHLGYDVAWDGATQTITITKPL